MGYSPSQLRVREISNKHNYDFVGDLTKVRVGEAIHLLCRYCDTYFQIEHKHLMDDCLLPHDCHPSTKTSVIPSKYQRVRTPKYATYLPAPLREEAKEPEVAKEPKKRGPKPKTPTSTSTSTSTSTAPPPAPVELPAWIT